jgi:predicted transcriptional regulator
MAKAGRPVEYGERTNTAIRFPPELHERVQTAAKERDVSMNWLVNKAVADFLDRLIPVDEMKWTRS